MGAFPQIADWNEDGKKDLLVGDTNGNITLFTNTGSNTNPVLSKTGFIQAGGTTLDVGVRATPVVVDWNNDGKKDLLSGNSNGYVLLYLNVGSNSSPSFGSATYITASGSNIVHSESCCEVCDLDADGKKDLLVGEYAGNIYFYSNTGTDANPAFASGVKLQAGSGNLDVSYYARFDAVDWDEDGDRDLVVGDWDAYVYLFLNTSGPVGRITVTAPNGGEVWDERSNQEITWTFSGTSGKVNIRITSDGGTTWSSIYQGTEDDGSFWWTIGYVDSNETDGRIKIEDVSNPNLADVSDRYFTIRNVPAISITVDQPNGGEVWNERTTYQIKWRSQNTCGYVALYYSFDSGNSWTTITTSTPDDGVENWTTPEVATDQNNCRVKVQDRDQPNYWDLSNGNFTIKNVPVGSIAVVQPNGGEIWYEGYSMEIKWNSQNNSGNVKIELSRNGGSTWETLFATVPDDWSQFWTVTGPTSTNCIIRIADVDGSPFDQSDEMFNIASGPEWAVPINVYGAMTFSRTFGGDAAASDGYDAAFDVMTASPGTTYYAYFELGASPTYLDTDIRKWEAPYTRDIHWTLKIMNAEGINSQLNWNAAALPAVETFTLIVNTTQVNMRTQSSISISGNSTVIIKYSSGVVFDFPRQGWYLISLPVIPTTNSVSSLFPSAIAAYGYNPTTGTYEAATTLEPRKGYWLLIPSPISTTVPGSSLTGFTQYYTAGWHLIGAVAGGADFGNPNDNPNGAILAAHGYDPATGTYFQVYPPGAGRLEEKQGYWLAVLQPCYLTIGTGAAGSDVAGVPASPPALAQQFGALPPAPPATTGGMLPIPAVSAELNSCCHPNPFNSELLIEYELPRAGFTQIYVYNALGQCIRTQCERHQGPGQYIIAWDGKNDNFQTVANGLYFYRIAPGGQAITAKIMLLK